MHVITKKLLMLFQGTNMACNLTTQIQAKWTSSQQDMQKKARSSKKRGQQPQGYLRVATVAHAPSRIKPQEWLRKHSKGGVVCKGIEKRTQRKWERRQDNVSANQRPCTFHSTKTQQHTRAAAEAPITALAIKKLTSITSAYRVVSSGLSSIKGDF